MIHEDAMLVILLSSATDAEWKIFTPKAGFTYSTWCVCECVYGILLFLCAQAVSGTPWKQRRHQNHSENTIYSTEEIIDTL